VCLPAPLVAGFFLSSQAAAAAQGYRQASQARCVVIAVAAQRDRIGLLQYRISGRGYSVIGR
jgi:hypothetical protein